MEEEVPTPKQTAPPQSAPAGQKQRGKWFRKIPKEILLSPGGVVLIFLAGVIEIIDWIPVPIIDNLWELPLEIIFVVFLSIIAKLPIQSMIIPFLLERVPILNDIIPTWLIRLFS